jgi:diguanylate cyclase
MGIKSFLNQLLEAEAISKPSGTVSGTPIRPEETSGGDPKLVQALVGTLRAMGEGSFDMDDADGDTVRARFEELAAMAESGSPEKIDTIAETVAAHRRRERHWVTKVMRDLGETVVSLMTRLGRNVTLDRSADLRVEIQLKRLRGAVAQDNLMEVRKEVLSAADTIAGALKERDDRQRSEMAAISRQLESLKSELTHTRKEMALDGLTRIYNRASLDEHLASVSSLAVLSGREACLLMVDVDHFKAVNDTWGHQAGDAVLKAIAEQLVKAFPRRTDFVGRYGGEEFAVVLGEDGAGTGMMLAQRLLDKARNLVVPWEDQEIKVTVSVGVAGFHDNSGADPRSEDPVRDWVARADKALYAAKSEGRDRAIQG